MPTYVYQCFTCETSKDVVQSIHDKALDNLMCEVCGYHMNRVYTPPAITFKGGGFYSTSSRE